MRTPILKSAMMKSVLAATFLLSASGLALAQQQVNLTAAPANAALPDGSTVPMWGYSCGAVASGSTATCAALNVAAAAATVPNWSPVVITVPTGQDLQINLTNSLQFTGGGVPTSIVIVGQLGGGLGTDATSTPSPDHSAVRSQTWPIASNSPVSGDQAAPHQGNRVQSFATEVAPGATTSLCWGPSCTTPTPALLPGTYLIESGTHPSIQGPMGLYGILVVTTAPTGTAAGTAYAAAGSQPAVSYNADVALLLSEIDPVQNTAVSQAVNTTGFSETAVWSGAIGACGDPTVHSCYPPAVNYTPLYYLVNGQAFDTANVAASVYGANPATGVTGNLLVRVVNAGLRMHVPSIVGAMTTGPAAAPVPGMTLVAEDGNVLPGLARIQNEVFMAAGKTYDLLINAPAAGTAAPAQALPFYDRELSLSANATGRNAGMLAYIAVNGAAAPVQNAGTTPTAAQANPDSYALFPGQLLRVMDQAKGVIANDKGVYAVQLLAAPASGTVSLFPNGTFEYFPTAGTTATTDSFTYCANGTVSGTGTTSVCSSNIVATVTLGPSTLSDSGVTCTTPAPYTSATASSMSVKTPGVLAYCTDGAGLPLTVQTSSVTASGGSVLADANGGFTASVSAPGTYTYAFTVQNAKQQTATVTATVVFPAASNLAVTVLDGADHATKITDYRWIIEEDRTFYVDPACTTNPLPASCPTVATNAAAPVNYGTNFHTSSMPVVAAGCTGTLSCEGGQTVQGVASVCDVGNGVCRPDTSGNGMATMDPSAVVLDPSKRYYISILPGDAANPFNAGYLGAPDCSAAGVAAGSCGHGMGGAPIPAACGPQAASDPVTGLKPACPATGAAPAAFAPVTVLTMPTPLQPATLSVFVFEDDYPLNGEQDSGGGVDVLSPQEPGLGGFQVTIFDQAGGTGDATGQPTYDMFNQPLSNSLAGTIDPVSGLDACPISAVASANAMANTANAANPAYTPASTSTGMIITCPKFESDGQTLSPLAGQAIIKNLYPGRYGVSALPGASRIALGEEWVQTNTLDGQKAHDSFLRVGEPGYFQEFGPAGFHATIGFANPKIINERRNNDAKTGMCDPSPTGGALGCTYEVKGKVTGSRMSRTPDQRLYSSGSRDALSFTQCYVSLGDPDGADFAFSKCDADGNFDFKNVPAGNWKITTFDQWNDQIIDGITQPVAVGCNNSISGLCTVAGGPTNTNTTCAGPTSTASLCDMGEIGAHQWHANIYTRTFIDMTGTGVSDDSKPGLALVATNVRFRDGSYSNFNNTDLGGNAGFNEVFPLFNWYVVETDSTRYKGTGVHVIYDAGGPADGSSSCNNTGTPMVSPCGNSSTASMLANTYEKYPLPADLSVPGAVYCDTGNADCVGESIANGAKPSSTTKNSTGRIDPPFWFGSYGWQGYIGQGNFLEWGEKPYATNETGPIHGHVVYASTRPFDDPQLLLQLSWEPLVAHVHVNLYREDTASDGVTQTLTLVDQTDTTSWDDWAQGFRSDGKPNMNCPGQQGASDPFYYALKDQPEYLDWYKNVLHGNGTTSTTALPYDGQYKCYDGMHTWNQLQPAPYDGMYSFPSVTGFDPATGKPSGSNCTACVPNPDTTDPYRVGSPMLPPGKYVVEVVVPPGYELVKEEDKNILIGDNYIAPAAVQIPNLASAVYILPDQATLAQAYNPLNPQNATTGLGRNPALPSHEGDTGSIETYWPCVGEVRQVPDYISLYPQSGEVAPFAGAFRPLCDRKEVTLDPQTSALAKFYIFSSTHVAAHFTGIILDDFAAEFDPFSPQFGEKFAPSYVPVGVKDWSGNAINRVYTDQFGLYNGLNYSTWEVNPPNPTGYAPTMMTVCMNDAGLAGKPDPLFQPGYSQFCYELPFMPGQTGYFDTPVVPVQAFGSGSYNTPDCSYPDATPAVASVTGDVAGPWVSAGGKPITIAALGDQSVNWYGYSGPSTTTAPYNQQKVNRHYGFGSAQGTVTIGGLAASVTSWSDTSITVTVPGNMPNCAVQQQAVYGGSPAQCGQLVITTSTGKQSVDAVTVTVGGKAPTVLAAGQTIQSAIDAAQPGDMIIVPAGTYNEMLVMWKPVRLQGVGAATTTIDANTQPSGILLDPWRQKIVGLFGLTRDGRPDTAAGGTCANDGTQGQRWCNFATMKVDRLPFEATLGWDATLNGNLAEQLIEPSLLGAYEGAAITVLGKGVKFPSGTSILDAFGATTGTPGASFPTDTTLLSASDCLVKGANPYPSNFACNPSSIDGLGIRDSSQGGGGIFVHAYAHNLQIANNRVSNNTGTMSGGMTIGAGEHPEVALGGNGQTILSYPTSCETSNVQNLSLPFCFNMHVNIHHNSVVGNSSMGDELFSSTPAGAGGVSINTGADYYQFKNNWVCGNLSSGDGGGVSHIGFIKNGDIEHNTIIFNQSTNPSISTNGGGLLVMGAPDADPTTCGVSTDLDCLPPPGTITPSDGSGPGLVVNANLILGNAADSGSGGGLRMQHVNGTDVLNIPSIGNNHAAACSADLGTAGGNARCYWNSVNVTNNIIVDNVAGWDGGGVSLLDALAVNIVNNTIASNDSTASAGTLFQALYAPLASAAAPSGNVICGATGGQSCPQVAGLVSINDSPVLTANIQLLAATPAANPFRCPAGHGTGTWSGASYAGTYTAPSCVSYSIPALGNDAIWQNRSFYIGVGGRGSVAANQNQQNVVTLYPKGSTTAAANQTATGGCPAGSSYWDLGFRGDTDVTSHAASGFAPNYSVLAAAYGGSSDSTTSPAFIAQYCNGSRSPPELGAGGYAVPPGVNEFNGFPNPIFTLNPAGVVDEGNNWVNVNWGPLALASPATGVVLANYTPSGATNSTTSSMINKGSANPPAGTGFGAPTVAAPRDDYFGNIRPAGSAYDIGAVEVGALPPLAVLNVTGGPLAFGNQAVGYASASQTLTLHNTGNVQATGISLTFSSTAFARSGGSCGTTLAAGGNCTINVTFTPAAQQAYSGTLNLAASVLVAGSPVTLDGTGVAPVAAATLTPATWSATTNPGCGLFACPVQNFTLRNTGNVPLTGISQGSVTGATEFTVVQFLSSCGTLQTQLAPNATCTILARFAPPANESNTGTISATLSVTAGAAGATTATLSGTAINLASVSPASGVRGTTAAVTLSGFNVGAATGVNVSGSGVTCTVTGAPTANSLTASCAITAGAAVGSRNMTATTAGGASNAVAFTVNGASGAALALTGPAPSLVTGTTTTHTGLVTVTNSASATGSFTFFAAPSITKVGGAGGAFSIATGGSCTGTTALSPGQSCTINVQYAPGGSRTTATAFVTVTGNGLGAQVNSQNSANFTAN